MLERNLEHDQGLTLIFKLKGADFIIKRKCPPGLWDYADKNGWINIEDTGIFLTGFLNEAGRKSLGI